MLEVIKSDSCGISAIFFQCCFMIQAQVLMTVSDFWGIFSRNHFLEGGFTFQWGEVVSQMGGFIVKWGGLWGASILMMGVSKKNCRIGGGGGGLS